MRRERFPETVPFRLTRMLVNAMEVSGVEGTFRSTCERVMGVLRTHRDSLMAMLEAFIHDPLIKWRLLQPEHPSERSRSRATSCAASCTASAPAGGAAGGVAGGAAGAVWYEVNVSGATPTLVQSGRIAAAAGEHTIFPAVAVNDGGSVALVYGRTSATLNPTLEVAGRLPCDPPGVLGASTVIGASTTSPSGSNQRWGDYFATAIDPVDGRTFWVIGELRNGAGWTTEIASLRIGRPGDLSGDGVDDLLGIAYGAETIAVIFGGGL
jgi:hypothetical protein